LKILVSAADKASSAGFWAHFNIVTYYYYYYYYILTQIYFGTGAELSGHFGTII